MTSAVIGVRWLLSRIVESRYNIVIGPILGDRSVKRENYLKHIER